MQMLLSNVFLVLFFKASIFFLLILFLNVRITPLYPRDMTIPLCLFTYLCGLVTFTSLMEQIKLYIQSSCQVLKNSQSMEFLTFIQSNFSD